MRTSQILALAMAMAGTTLAKPVPPTEDGAVASVTYHSQLPVAQAAPTVVARAGTDEGAKASVPHLLPSFLPRAAGGDGCTTTLPILAAWTWGPTRTFWTATSTTTHYLDCGHCTAVATTFLNVGVPPVVIFRATTTAADATTTTVLGCQSTAAAVTA
jgi:hypothetical protein